MYNQVCALHKRGEKSLTKSLCQHRPSSTPFYSCTIFTFDRSYQWAPAPSDGGLHMCLFPREHCPFWLELMKTPEKKDTQIKSRYPYVSLNVPSTKNKWPYIHEKESILSFPDFLLNLSRKRNWYGTQVKHTLDTRDYRKQKKKKEVEEKKTQESCESQRKGMWISEKIVYYYNYYHRDYSCHHRHTTHIVHTPPI